MPSAAQEAGLPLITLHEAFLSFVNESKSSLPVTEMAACKTAFRLCDAMAQHYDEEIDRRNAFNAALDPFISKALWLPEITIGGEPGMSGQFELTEHCRESPECYLSRCAVRR
jgi:hypothetical protein